MTKKELYSKLEYLQLIKDGALSHIKQLQQLIVDLENCGRYFQKQHCNNKHDMSCIDSSYYSATYKCKNCGLVEDR